MRLDRVWLACAAGTMLAGCVTIHQPAGGDPSTERAPAAPQPHAEGEPGTVRGLPPMLDVGDEARALERLGHLRDERQRTGTLADPPVGPGDVIEVAAPQVKELAFVTTRVSGDGIIALPIVGTIHAGGRTEDAIRQDIRTRLGAVMYDPQVSVFVREYRSRRVTLIGAVTKSGLYEPASRNETIFDMLAMAQGPSNDAARQVVFIPNGAADGATRFRLSQLADDRFDCVVVGHALDRTFDVRPLVKALHRVLRPGGVLLATLPGAGNVGPDTVHDTYWTFTPLAAQTLFEEVFPSAKLAIEPAGNVLAATAALAGLAAEELRARELAHRDATYAVVLGVRAVKPTPEWTATLVGRWQYGNAAPFPYGDDVTYRKGMAFLDGHGTIEDWGAGTGYARRFVTRSAYRAVDGSPSLGVDRVVDLRTYRSSADCIFMRHVLEHNPDWRRILENALQSFARRMVLVVFTPFADETHAIASWQGIPDLAFRKEELVACFAGIDWREESVATNTEYLREHVFYVERRAALRRAG